MTHDPALNAEIARECALAALAEAKARGCTQDIHRAQVALKKATREALACN